MARIAFIDCEASGLDDPSYPIEIGWVLDDGAEESHLIAPEPDWSHWDPRSEEIHGISREELIRDGEPCGVVARRMSVTLSGFMVFSDAPDADQIWLLKLFRAAKVLMPFRVLAIQELFAQAVLPLLEEAKIEKGARAKELVSVLRHALSRAESESWVKAASEAPRTHRALADARHLAAVWKHYRTAFRALMDDEPATQPALLDNRGRGPK